MRDASVYIRKGSSKWYVSYWCAKRMKRVHEATPWGLDEPAGKKLATRFAEAKASAAAAFRGHAKKEVFGAWAHAFLENHYRTTPRTLQRMLNAYDWIRLFITEHDLHHPAAVRYTDANRYLEWRVALRRHNGNRITRNTAILELKVWGILMGEAVKRGFASVNPFLRMGLKRDAPKQKPEISADEITTIRAALRRREGNQPIGERWMTVCFEIALHQGCRLRETQLPLTAVDFAAGTIQFTAKGRNGRPNVFTTALHPELRPLLVALRDAGATTTCTLPRMASTAWHAFFRELKLDHLCFHCTRVTVITRLARAGVPIQQAMRFVGHASEAVHQIYQRLKSEDLTLCTAALRFSADTAARPQSPGATGATS